jgi:formylglycine-generating enzyme required for sulfatase activity
MNGNVWQWCLDWYGDYPGGAVTDPAGPDTGTKHVARGGSWINGVAVCRSAYRNEFLPDRHSRNIGFRVALCEVPFAPFANEPERLETFRP